VAELVIDDAPDVSVVIPAYNEGAKILGDLERACAYLGGGGYRYEVVVVDDGSTDDTSDKVREFQRRGHPVKLLGYAGNRGKGFAVRTGMLQAAGRLVLFADAGGCVPYAELEKGRRRLEEGWDVAIGSRGLGDSRVRVRQAWHRQLGSRGFGFLVHHVMGLRDFADTQCGFKIFRREAAQRLFGAARIDGFMFDIEMLVNARRLGLRVCEFPVEWTADPDSRFRVVAGSVRNLRELVRIFFGRAR
jgi:dolichyl-phosphate beta-glucosyltransferase